MSELKDKDISVLVAFASLGLGTDSYILKDIEAIEGLTGYSRGALYSIINRLKREGIIEQRTCKNEIRREVKLTPKGYEVLCENYTYILQSLRNCRANSTNNLNQR